MTNRARAPAAIFARHAAVFRKLFFCVLSNMWAA
jgi:hypothetical protein